MERGGVSPRTPPAAQERTQVPGFETVSAAAQGGSPNAEHQKHFKAGPRRLRPALMSNNGLSSPPNTVSAGLPGDGV